MQLATGTPTYDEYYLYAIVMLVCVGVAIVAAFRRTDSRGGAQYFALLASPLLFFGHIYLLFVWPQTGTAFSVHAHQLSLAEWIVAYAAIAAVLVSAGWAAVDWVVGRRRDAVVQFGFASSLALLLTIGSSRWAPEFIAGLVIVLAAVMTYYQLTQSERASEAYS